MIEPTREIRQVRCPNRNCRRTMDIRSRIGIFTTHTKTCPGCRRVYRIEFGDTEGTAALVTHIGTLP